MAVVTLLEPTDMTALPTALTTPNRKTTGVELTVFFDFDGTFPASVTIKGTFQNLGASGWGAGHISSVLVDTNDLGFYQNILIDGLSIDIGDTDSYYFNTLAGGNLMQFVGSLLSGRDHITGTDGADGIMGFGGRDVIDAGGGGDVVDGGDGGDEIYGGKGADILVGGAGKDRLYGGPDSDQMAGGTNDDILNGGPGHDEMESDEGADIFEFDKTSDSRVGGGANGRDIILFFSHADGDLIDLSTIDANRHVAGNQKFEFIRTDAFTGNASDSRDRGEVRFDKVNGVSIVQGDVNGDKVADFEIEVRASSLHGNDFIL